MNLGEMKYGIFEPVRGQFLRTGLATDVLTAKRLMQKSSAYFVMDLETRVIVCKKGI